MPYNVEIKRVVSLRDGRQMVIGGRDIQGEGENPRLMRSVEFYDDKGKLRRIRHMSIGRNNVAAVVLNDGRVLITGGEGQDKIVLDSCEIYDPVSNSFANVASMMEARRKHAIVLLPTNDVLVVGGVRDFNMPRSSCEIYNVCMNKWEIVSHTDYSTRCHYLVVVDEETILDVSDDEFHCVFDHPRFSFFNFKKRKWTEMVQKFPVFFDLSDLIIHDVFII
jgi:hypothetical protein